MGASNLDDAAAGFIGNNPTQYGDDVFYDAEEEFNTLMNLMSKRNQANYLY